MNTHIGHNEHKTVPLAIRVYRAICAHPEGVSRKEICHEMDVASHRLGQLLTSLEGTNMLVSEDRGFLYPAYF